MKTAIATRFRCSRPLSDLFKMTLMFLTLIFQYLNKLVEGEVGNLTSPKPFHAVNVQGFKDNRIKLFTKFRGKLPMKVFTLIGDFPIEACELSHTPPPAVRAFDFTAKFFVERPKFVQGLFQRLAVVYLLTRAKCQVCVFHTEVCPNAFTCCRQRFEICVGCRDTKPIGTASITFDSDTANSPMPLAVFMERVWHFIQLLFTCLGIPFTESQRDTIIFQRPPRFTGVGNRFELMSLFDFGSTPKFFEKTIVCIMDPFEFLLNRLRRQSIPMRVCRILQNFHVVTHALKVDIRQPVFMTLTLPLMEVFMNLPHIVKQVANAHCIRLFPKRIFTAFHGRSSIKSLTPVKWVGRHTTKQLCFTCLPT